jgi:malonate-semialdehyde dehydrogenase (acetylating)/methylmalonate-semialdehyde dehydrogenase
MAELLKQAGLPDGVLNVVQRRQGGGGRAADRPEVGAVSLVGSTPIAQYIYATASAHGKRVQALGGAKNHMVVMPDADLDQAVSALMGPPMARRASAAWRSRWPWWWVTRPPMPWWRSFAAGGGARVGPVRSGERDGAPHQPRAPGQGARLRGSGGGRGAELVVDGRGLSHGEGYFIGGSLFDRVGPEMRIYREEIFGPVLAIVRAPDYETALRLINEHEYGNGTAIFTCDGDTQGLHRPRAGRYGRGERSHTGAGVSQLRWLEAVHLRAAQHARPDGVRFYARMKTVTARWPQSLRAGAEFSMPTMK